MNSTVTRISAFFVLSLVAALSIDMAFGNASAPPAARTGAPGEGTCASSCHTGTAVNGGAGSVSILFNGGINTYQAGLTYPVTVTVTDPSLAKYGFQITALTGGTGASVGTFTLTNTTNTATQLGNVGGLRRYVGHKSANTNGTWSFDWTAPTNITSPITFYAVGNATNGNFGQSGDKVYTSNLTIDFVVGLEDASITDFSVWPVPAKDFLNVDMKSALSGDQELLLLDMQGRVIQRVSGPGATHRMDVQDLDAGIYFLQLRSESGTTAKKIVKE